MFAKLIICLLNRPREKPERTSGECAPSITSPYQSDSEAGSFGESMMRQTQTMSCFHRSWRRFSRSNCFHGTRRPFRKLNEVDERPTRVGNGSYLRYVQSGHEVKIGNKFPLKLEEQGSTIAGIQRFKRASWPSRVFRVLYIAPLGVSVLYTMPGLWQEWRTYTFLQCIAVEARRTRCGMYSTLREDIDRQICTVHERRDLLRRCRCFRAGSKTKGSPEQEVDRDANKAPSSGLLERERHPETPSWRRLGVGETACVRTQALYF
ncbi:hypothetical protein B0T16DRAFT_153284 [Cercophora newfieldiana]|uniref:Uncharacterized protein n=1 Tax=Cercophora newfieldiana TaxID=92897 RepID=A0AA39Y750_9PEZI|nr:hypothetical protein B0T16DRAFT_153284 [Cercophora newfieldiana]